LLIDSIVALLDDGAAQVNRRLYADTICQESQPASDEESDPDLDALCSQALMQLSPWNYYNSSTANDIQPMFSWLLPVKARLFKSVTSASGPHPLAIHLLIHLLEPSNAPAEFRWEALRPTRLLFQTLNGTALVPAQGHLTHMPAHLFLRVGWYKAAVEASARTVANNGRYHAACLNPYGYGHNTRMLVTNARFAGMKRTALSASKLVTSAATSQEQTPCGKIESSWAAGPGSPELLFTQLRFGLFTQVLDQPFQSSAQTGFPPFNASYHYSRAIAFWALGQTEQGDAEVLEVQRSTVKMESPWMERMNFEELMTRELAAVRAWRVDRNASAAVVHLKAAVEVEDRWTYNEPPTWYYPIHQCLGTAYLLDAKPDLALQSFTKDLKVFPENGWSLFGSALALKSMGKRSEAAAMQGRAEIAWQSSETTLESPCFQLTSTF